MHVRKIEKPESPTKEQIDSLINNPRASNWRCWRTSDIISTLCSLIGDLGQWTWSIR